MSVCDACGAVVAEDTRFCQTCGSPTELKACVSKSAVERPALVAVMRSYGDTGSKKMDTNVVGALTYLAGFVTGFIFLVLEPYKSNSFVRFHAFQSIFFNVAWVVFWIVWMVLSAALTPLTAGAFGFIALPLTVIVTLAGFGMWVFLMYEAYQQRLFRCFHSTGMVESWQCSSDLRICRGERGVEENRQRPMECDTNSATCK